jgi:hypothetical protein
MLHEARDRDFFLGRHEQMHVICHQHVGM